jgi:tripartite-type tricarboxylate transporter receptor subunit TctC
MYTFNRIANPTPGFDREKDFVTSIGIGKNHYAIMVNKDSDVKTLEQLITKIKSKPESFMAATLTSPGAIMLNEMFVKKFNLNVKQINYKTPAEILLAVQNKEVDYTLFTVPDMQQLRALAVSSAQRLETFPEAPTARELGFPEFETSSILLFSVPRDNGRFLTTFETDMMKVCKSPEFEPVAKLRSPYLSYCLTAKEAKEVVDAENVLINRAYGK